MSYQRSCLSSPVLLVSDGISKCNIKYMNKPLLVPVFGPWQTYSWAFNSDWASILTSNFRFIFSERLSLPGWLFRTSVFSFWSVLHTVLPLIYESWFQKRNAALVVFQECHWLECSVLSFMYSLPPSCSCIVLCGTNYLNISLTCTI